MSTNGVSGLAFAVRAGQYAQMKENNARSVVKTLSWRGFATLITFLLAFGLGGDLALAAMIGGADTLVKLVAYYFHERTWARSNFGMEIHPLADLTFSKKLSDSDKAVIVEQLQGMGYLEGK